MGEPMFKPGDKLLITVAEVYKSDTKLEGLGNNRSADYVYRMKGDIPLMRERQLKLLERVRDEL